MKNPPAWRKTSTKRGRRMKDKARDTGLTRIAVAALVALAVGAAGPAWADGTRSVEVRDEWSGWWHTNQEADVDGDLQGGAIGENMGRGRLGRFTNGTSSDLLPWDGASFCDFDADGYPIAVTLYYVSLDVIGRYADGDLLYYRAASSPPGQLCFNFVDNSFTMEVHYDLVGGTGRFEGATGRVVTVGAGQDFLTGFGSAYGTSTGLIHGVSSQGRGPEEDEED